MKTESFSFEKEERQKFLMRSFPFPQLSLTSDTRILPQEATSEIKLITSCHYFQVWGPHNCKGFSRVNDKYSSYLDILAASPLSRAPLLGVLSNPPPTCREGLPLPRLQRRKQELQEGLPKAPRGGGFVPEPLPQHPPSQQSPCCTVIFRLSGWK